MNLTLSTEDAHNLVTHQDFEFIHHQHVRHKLNCSAENVRLFNNNTRDKEATPVPKSIISLTNQNIDLDRMNKLHALIQLGYHTIYSMIHMFWIMDAHSPSPPTGDEMRKLTDTEFKLRTSTIMKGQTRHGMTTPIHIEIQATWLSETFILIQSEHNLNNRIMKICEMIKFSPQAGYPKGQQTGIHFLRLRFEMTTLFRILVAISSYYSNESYESRSTNLLLKFNIILADYEPTKHLANFLLSSYTLWRLTDLVTHEIVSELIKESGIFRQIDPETASIATTSEEHSLNSSDDEAHSTNRQSTNRSGTLPFEIKAILDRIGNPNDESSMNQQVMALKQETEQDSSPLNHQIEEPDLDFSLKIITHEALTFLNEIHELLSVKDLELIDKLLATMIRIETT